jgi:hypothetical protein
MDKLKKLTGRREALTEPKNDPNYIRSSEDWLKERVAPKESGTIL